MGVIEDEYLPCPFCDKGQIWCGHVPSRVNVKYSRTATFGKTKNKSKSREIWMVRSGCSKCGKSQEEVEKGLLEKGLI